MKLVAILIFAISSLSAQAEDLWSRVEQNLYKRMQTEQFVNYVLDGYSLAGMPKEVLREHLVEVYKSRDVIKILVKEMRQAGLEKLNEQDMEGYGRKFGGELFFSLAMKGMARLPPEDQRFFLSFLNTWLHQASVNDCKWMMTDAQTSSASEAAKIEMKYYEKFRKDELRSYFGFLRRAMFAEINNFPAARSINQDQAKIADDAFRIILERKIKQGSVRAETLRAISDMNNSSAKDVCDAGKLIYSTVLDMKGFVGALMTTKVILSMQ
jgi:hypothetical protein